MRPWIALVAMSLLGPSAAAVEPPPSISNARVEVRAGTTPAAAIDRAAREKAATWVGWSVAALPDAGSACCFTSSFKRRGCSLAERESSWGTSDSEGRTLSAELYILVEERGGSPVRVKMFSPDCPVDGADRRLVWLGPVEAGASLSALGRLVEARGDEVGAPALVAVAHHQDPRADALIEKRALDRSLSPDDREQAIFWAGQARGEAGLRLIDRVLDTEPSGDLRQHAVFALSQSSVAAAPARIKRAAVEDRDPDVRAHALFSLSQTHDPDAGPWIVSRLDAERNEEVREQAVFALSQLDDGTDWLLEVLRSNREPETIRRALFWLGQSDDPRALEEIEKILDR